MHVEVPPTPRRLTRSSNSDTEQLLAFADAAVRAPNDAAYQDRIETFLGRYRTWILRKRGMSGDTAAWAERHSIILHLMISGSTLREAVALLIRFTGSVWGMRTRYELREQGGKAFLVVEERERSGQEGIISTLWVLSIIRCQLEFLVGRRLEDLSACLRQEQCLPAEVTQLLFRGAANFSARETGLCMASGDLDHAVTASVSQIPAFLADLMRATLAGRASQEIATHVANLIWRDATRSSPDRTPMASIARQMGMSVSTLRRQLGEERRTFKEIHGDVFDRLAKSLLHETDLGNDQIAERLGYSNAFAFRRAFSRRNGIPPSLYRKSVARRRSSHLT